MNAIRVSLALLGAMGLVSACGSFLSSPDNETPAVDADASSDAPIAPEAAATDDAGADASDAATTATCKSTTLPVFLEDFATTYDLLNWEPLSAKCDDGGTTYPARDAGDLSLSLGCSTKVTESYNVVQSIPGFPNAARTHFSFAFRIGSTESHVFAQLVHFFGSFGANLAIVATPANIELWNREGGARLTFWPAGDQTKWRHMEIDFSPLDPIGEKIAMRAALDGEERTVAELARKPDGGEAQFRVQLGPYLNVAGGTFDDAYDAVRIWSCP